MQPKHPQCTLEGEVACSDANSLREPVNAAKHSNSKTQNAAPSRNSKAKRHGQEKCKRSRENNSKKTEDNREPWFQDKGPEKTQVRAQKPDISADKECPSPSQHELPPPGKVKLVPLPFLSPEKPQPRPVYRRPQSLASRRPTVAYPAQPTSTSSAQPRAVNQSRPAPANTSFMRPAKPAQSAVSHSIHSGFTTSTQPSVPQSAASRPAAYTTSSCTSVQRGPVSTLVNKLQSQPPKPQNRYLLQDFALQPIPWRKPNVPEPVMSTPITEEQRPEREAMKKKAQQECENAAKYPLGRVQFFIEREREMEFAHYYGYTI
ncbi:hypothetical protein SUZIE_207095 [Sciurus carolinensis]|uniref:DUF4629 domain-containing protein n=1 Tax=Sciurus carolinensis TaxID=30640 RepID=A0AA41T9Q4_SCICA|nr:hypothetical protein [Sciurus carolinensis]